MQENVLPFPRRAAPRRAPVGQVETFGLEALEAGHQADATQEMAEGKGDLGLPVRVHDVFLHAHLGVMADQALDHGRDFGEREVAQLRVDTDCIRLKMPIHEHPVPAVA